MARGARGAAPVPGLRVRARADLQHAERVPAGHRAGARPSRCSCGCGSTPIVYVEQILPPDLRAVMRYNPAYPFIDALHRMISEGEWPSAVAMAGDAALGGRDARAGLSCPEAPAAGDPRRAVSETAISVRDLSKRFKLYRNPWDRVVEWVTGGRVVRHESFWALQGINLEVKRGECVGHHRGERRREDHAAEDPVARALSDDRRSSRSRVGWSRCSSWARASIPS